MTQTACTPHHSVSAEPLRPELNQERTELALAHLGLADALAHRYWNARSDWCDLQQVARLGLLKAAIRFRMDADSNFVAYAVPTICGEIKRHLRDHGWMVRPPRRIQDLRQQVRRTAPELAQQLGHEPTAAELAAVLAVAPEDIDEALLSESSVQPLSLDAPGPADAGSALCERLGSDDEDLARVDELVSLNSALRGLTPWERRLLALRFQEDLKQQDIADLLNISQMQVSRTLAALLDKLRRQLGED
jgi:RNA polymerase sigma-B factor